MRPAVQGRQRGLMQRYFQTSDILQEAAVQILGEIDKRGEEGLEVNQSWLNKVGRGHANRLIKFHSAQKRSAILDRHEVDEVATQGPKPDDIAESKEMCMRLVLCLGSLTEVQRSIVDQYQVQGKSFREIGVFFSKPEHWARRQFHASLKKLKSLMIDGAE